MSTAKNQPVSFLEEQNANDFSLFIALIAVLSYGKILFLNAVFEDDNCWLLSVYASRDTAEFLKTGWVELRRIPQGIFLYNFLSLHKISSYAFLVWQAINLSIQIISPVVLYLFLKKLFRGKQIPAFWIAGCFIIFPIDTTLPVFSNIFYRLGIAFTIISFYLTARAVEKNIQWLFLSIAVVLTAVSQYFLLEGTVAFEPARLFVVANILQHKKIEIKTIVRRTVIICAPFIALTIPIVAYKLIFKPYGIYFGEYKTDPLFFLDWKMHKQLIKMLVFNNWYALFKSYVLYASKWSVILAISAIILWFHFFRANPIFVGSTSKSVDERKRFRENLIENLKSVKFILLSGIIFFIPAMLMYEFAGRVPIFGVNSRHGIILQIGYSILLGSLLWFFFKAFRYLRKPGTLKVTVALLFGLGVFINNLNLDLYFDSLTKQKQFWKTFVARFPALPEKTDFFMDIQADTTAYSVNLDTSYDLELVLNVLYATSENPEKFRNYRVLAPDEWKTVEGYAKSGNFSYERISHWGKESINSNSLIVIHYRKDKLLVNREILKKYPDIYYQIIADRDSPNLPPPAVYPLRQKLKGFYL